MSWIPVSESMPEARKIVLACYLNNAGNYRIIRCKWYPAYTEVTDIDLCGWGDYDEKTDEYYTPEGWYECIDNWDEYESVFFEDDITHWMELPEPPNKDT